MKKRDNEIKLLLARLATLCATCTAIASTSTQCYYKNGCRKQSSFSAGANINGNNKSIKYFDFITKCHGELYTYYYHCFPSTSIINAHAVNQSAMPTVVTAD